MNVSIYFSDILRTSLPPPLQHKLGVYTNANTMLRSG